MTATPLAYTPDSEIYEQLNDLASRHSSSVTQVLDTLVREGVRHASAAAAQAGERRKFTRKPSCIPAMLQTVGGKRNYTARAAVIRDISLGGVRITLSGEGGYPALEETMHVELVFCLGDAREPMIFTGRARRTSRHNGSCDLGMEFLDGSFKDYQTLAAYMVH